MDLAVIRAGLATNLSSITGFQVSAYLLSNPTPPAIEIEPGKIDYDKAMQRGIDEWNFLVRAFVSFSTDIGSQKRVDQVIASSGSMSIKAAVESDVTLGGAVDDLIVKGCTGYKVFLREATGSAGRGSPVGPLIGAEWTVLVYAKGM